jgi:hypothetical protein
MQMAREHGPGGVRGDRPERAYYEVRPQPSVARRAARLALLGAAVAACIHAGRSRSSP